MKININKVLILLVFLSALVSTGCSQPKKINNPPRLKDTQVQYLPDKGNKGYVLTHSDQKSNLNTTAITVKPKYSNDSSLIKADADTNMSNSSSDSTTKVVKATLSENAQNAYNAYCNTQKSLNSAQSQLNAIKTGSTDKIIVPIEVVKSEARMADKAVECTKQCGQGNNSQDKDIAHIKRFARDAEANAQLIGKIYQEMLQLKKDAAQNK